MRIAGEPERRSAIVMLRMPRAGEVVERLGRRGIIVDRRGEYIRVSPHFYNTAAENDELVAALAELRPAPP